MTMTPRAVRPLRSELAPRDLERLTVAARAVLEWAGETRVEGLAGARLDQITHHARSIEATEPSTPFGATRAHALTVRNELIAHASEQSLTLAVWFDDALGLGGHLGGPVTSDPAEHAEDAV